MPLMEKMMITVRGEETHTNPTLPLPIWKLYENPFFFSPYHKHHSSSYSDHHLLLDSSSRFPLSARKLAASLWYLSFDPHPSMDQEWRSQIEHLKAEIESERSLRKKAESLSKRVAKELAEERRVREAMGRFCRDLSADLAAKKSEIGRLRKEMEEERSMARTAEAWREERVQMKLSEARLVMEEKIAELSKERSCISEKQECPKKENRPPVTASQRRSSPEQENPHIKRGIKGFVEFPRVVRAVGSKGREVGSKVECQKAQLRVLLRQKSPPRRLAVAGVDRVVFC